MYGKPTYFPPGDTLSDYPQLDQHKIHTTIFATMHLVSAMLVIHDRSSRGNHSKPEHISWTHVDEKLQSRAEDPMGT